MYAIRSVPPIHIIVKNGHVTLEGSVATEADKDAPEFGPTVAGRLLGNQQSPRG